MAMTTWWWQDIGSTYFGHEDWRTFAPPMKILETPKRFAVVC